MCSTRNFMSPMGIFFEKENYGHKNVRLHTKINDVLDQRIFFPTRFWTIDTLDAVTSIGISRPTFRILVMYYVRMVLLYPKCSIN